VTEPEWPNEAFGGCNFWNAKTIHALE